MKIKTILRKINSKNFIKGIDLFSKILQKFGSAVEELTKELDQSPLKEPIKENYLQRESKSDSTAPKTMKFWPDTTESDGQDKINLEKIWGKSKVTIWPESLPDSECKDKINLEKFWGKND